MRIDEIPREVSKRLVNVIANGRARVHRRIHTYVSIYAVREMHFMYLYGFSRDIIMHLINDNRVCYNNWIQCRSRFFCS